MLALLKEFRQTLALFQSGIFTVVGILLGAWLSRRSERMRIRIERRTQIFDEACQLTAIYYQYMSARISPRFAALSVTGGPPEKTFFTDVMTLDRKILTHFSRKAYSDWRSAEKMIAEVPLPKHTATAFSDARDKALRALAEELQ